jgi:cytochrome c biogenesis protein CcmG, thiol:disulfide interchange protein DsbE
VVRAARKRRASGRGRPRTAIPLKVALRRPPTLGRALNRLLRPVPLVAIGGVLALLALLAFGLASQGSGSSIDSQIAAGKRPTFEATTLPTLDGDRKVPLSSYRGKVVVLNFWASWCTPCRTETPLLQRWHKRLIDRGGTIVGVDVLDVASDARAFVREFKLTYPQLRDGDGSHLKRFGVLGYPETVVLDRRGRIAATQRGTVDDAFFEKRVVPLLEERT